MPPRRPINRIRLACVMLVTTACLATGADLLTKEWAQVALADQAPVALIGDYLRLRLGFNSGVAFGLLADAGFLVPLLSLAVLLGFGVWLLHLLIYQNLPYLSIACAGLFLGGGLANLLDRLADGYVTDFIDVGLQGLRWPTFNLADVFIVTAGVAFFLLIDRRAEVENSSCPPLEVERGMHDPEKS